MLLYHLVLTPESFEIIYLFFLFLNQVMQYKQRCSELEGQMEDIETTRPTVTATPGSALDAAQQHLREIRGETTDLNTTLSQLDEEKRR
jgi:hypothetical protein